MKKILFIFLFLPVLAYSQGGTWPIKYNDSDPSGAPSASGTRVYFNTATNTLFFWEPAPSSTWRKQPKAFDQITGCAAPAYTPSSRQSTFAVNSCTPKPELYQWTGASWALLNPETLYTAGTGIDITGDVISNTGDLSETNELNTALYVDMGSLIVEDAGGAVSTPLSQLRGIYTEGTGIDIDFGTGAITNTLPNVVQTLSISGQDLSLSDGGGTVTIPAGADGNGIYSGSGTIPDETSATLTTGGTFGNREVRMLFGVPSYIQSLGDNFPEFGFEDYDPDNEVAAFFGYSSEQAGQFSFGAYDLPNNKSAGLLAAPGQVTIGASTKLSITTPLTEMSGVARLGRFTTTQRNAISSPATGYAIYNTDATATDGSTGVMQVYNGTTWKNAW